MNVVSGGSRLRNLLARPLSKDVESGDLGTHRGFEDEAEFKICVHTFTFSCRKCSFSRNRHFYMVQHTTSLESPSVRHFRQAMALVKVLFGVWETKSQRKLKQKKQIMYKF